MSIISHRSSGSKGPCCDSGSMVTLVRKGYFLKNILPLLQGSAGKLTEAHSLFGLSTPNNEVMLVSKYFEADVTILGFKIPPVGFLVVKDPNTLLEPQHSTQLLGVIGYNLIQLGCEEFERVQWFDTFKEFCCPANVHPVVFAQMCSFYHQGSLQAWTQTKGQVSINSVNVSSSETSSSEAKKKDPSSGLEATLGQVWVGNTHESICIPANSVKVVQGKTNKITWCLSCMSGARTTNNLPMGIVVNRTIVTPNKAKQVPIALVNTNSYNVWICQPLLAANVVEVEDCPWDYQPIMSCKGNEIKISFCPAPMSEVQEGIFSASMTNSGDTNKSKSKELGKRSKFGPWPKFNSPKFDSKKELDRLPFPVNIGEEEMSKSQQVRFLELINDNQCLFSLCNEDLGLCDHLKHTIPTTMDKPVYLPHHTILFQLQAEVHKWMDTWLKQGIIWPSQSMYTSQVVIVHKKSGEILLCIDFHSLNAITIHDSFPLLQIEEAL